MINTATTSITREDLHKIFELSGHKAEIIDFVKLDVVEEKKEAAPKEPKVAAGKKENKKEKAEEEEKIH